MKLTVFDKDTPHLGGNLRHGDLACINTKLWKFWIERFAIRSMLDVGCGEGHAVSFFHSHGVFSHGIDGLMANIRRAVIPIALHDLTKGPYFMPVDLTLSIEVAEHIEEEYSANYLDTLCNGKIIAMTHAVPGQLGHHHVNCQPKEYWVSKLADRGYILDETNDYWRGVAKSEGHATYFGNTGLLFFSAK